MKKFQLTDRVVVEVRGEECSLEQMAATLRAVAEMIEQGRKGGEFPIGNDGDVLWEHECVEYGGFRILSDKSLIRQYYYKSEPKPKKYIIIAHNYDRENSDAYPVDNRLFATEEEAKTYLREHIDDIKSNHWTATRVDGEDRYSEEFTCTGWEAHDSSDGSSLELTITEVTEE